MPEQTEARRAAQEKHDIEHPGPHGWSWPGPAPGVKIGLGDGEMMPPAYAPPSNTIGVKDGWKEYQFAQYMHYQEMKNAPKFGPPVNPNPIIEPEPEIVQPEPDIILKTNVCDTTESINTIENIPDNIIMEPPPLNLNEYYDLVNVKNARYILNCSPSDFKSMFWDKDEIDASGEKWDFKIYMKQVLKFCSNRTQK